MPAAHSPAPTTRPAADDARRPDAGVNWARVILMAVLGALIVSLFGAWLGSVLDDYDAPATWIPAMIGAIAAGATDYARQRSHSIR